MSKTTITAEPGAVARPARADHDRAQVRDPQRWHLALHAEHGIGLPIGEGPRRDGRLRDGAAPDPEFSRDNVVFFDRFDRGFLGYPTAAGMLHPILISNREEPVPWPNAELLVVRDDGQLADAVRGEKDKPGKALGVPGGIRTAQIVAATALAIGATAPTCGGLMPAVAFSQPNLDLLKRLPRQD